MDLATVDKLLTTTRVVRKRLDLERPVDLEVVHECLEIAIQAPTGSNVQGYRFMLVTDEEKRAKIAEYYGMAWQGYSKQVKQSPGFRDPNDPRAQRSEQTFSSAEYLAANMHRVPLLIIPCIGGREENPAPLAQASLYGSILPATWSLMLALRARGIGSAWTTLHLYFEQEVAKLLGIPDNFTQTALLPVAYYTGDDFRPAKRIPARKRTYLNTWNE